MVCAGCGAALSPAAPLPFRCPQADAPGDVDHVLRCELYGGDLEGIHRALQASEERSSFLRFRPLMHSYRLALRQGMSDADYCALVRTLDQAVAAVCGVGFVQTPYAYHPGLDLWLKDETGNVGGSHKARHLMGLAIHLDVVERLGLASVADRELVIASCGNAALAASVVAKAAGRRLRVFIPTSASRAVRVRLAELGAVLEVCARTPGDPPGDPCMHRFRAAVRGGSLPFSCQGSDNGLTIQGGMTLAWELASQHAQLAAGSPLDRVFFQVGGGAFASSAFQAWELLLRVGAVASRPRFFAVQTAKVYPMVRAFTRSRELARERGIEVALELSRTHRSEHMIPWKDAPESVAEGILDDETYDWAGIVEGLLATDGEVVLAQEAVLERACAQVEAIAGIRASATGTAGVAGVLTVRSRAGDHPRMNTAAVITGERR